MSQILENTAQSVAQAVRAFAEAHGILGVSSPIDALADHITRLSGDEIGELDETQLLLIALRRKGYLDKEEAMKVQAAYLAEKRLAL
ncbi:MAG: hypothetical protein KC910_01665 [Candidatus Eremiobacteraeota bacterium]|nr:hypothetical protein [Candidatus Eremiobacteraeota bacterium]